MTVTSVTRLGNAPVKSYRASKFDSSYERNGLKGVWLYFSWHPLDVSTCQILTADSWLMILTFGEERIYFWLLKCEPIPAILPGQPLRQDKSKSRNKRGASSATKSEPAPRQERSKPWKLPSDQQFNIRIRSALQRISNIKLMRTSISAKRPRCDNDKIFLKIFIKFQ